MSNNQAYVGSIASREASDYFNALPQEQRGKLAPLLEQYRQMGLAEARAEIQQVIRTIDSRVAGIRSLHDVPEIIARASRMAESEGAGMTQQILGEALEGTTRHA